MADLDPIEDYLNNQVEEEPEVEDQAEEEPEVELEVEPEGEPAGEPEGRVGEIEQEFEYKFEPVAPQVQAIPGAFTPEEEAQLIELEDSPNPADRIRGQNWRLQRLLEIQNRTNQAQGYVVNALPAGIMNDPQISHIARQVVSDMPTQLLGTPEASTHAMTLLQAKLNESIRRQNPNITPAEAFMKSAELVTKAIRANAPQRPAAAPREVKKPDIPVGRGTGAASRVTSRSNSLMKDFGATAEQIAALEAIR